MLGKWTALVARSAFPKTKINTKVTQPARGDHRQAIEMGHGITVYPPAEDGAPWRAAFLENGQRRFRQAATEPGLAAKLAKVTERLAAEATSMEKPGAALIAHYQSPDRHQPGKRWSRKHADTQRRLCERFVAPVIATIKCQDIKVAHMQQAVNAAPTADEGARLHRCLRAMVNAGISGGYLTSWRLGEVYWQAAGRAESEPTAQVQGETVLWVDPAEIPADTDVAKLGQALSLGRRGDLDELMAYTAAYSGLRQGELFALAASQVTAQSRVITVSRKVVEVGGKLYVEAPKGRKHRSTIYPVRTPDGYPLAEKLSARAEATRAGMEADSNPLGLMFPSPRGSYWRSSNFDRRVLAPAYQAAGWRDAAGNGEWTWHSLRHVFCVTALFTWKMTDTDVAQLAGHANSRVTREMYVGTTAGTLDRARAATR
jgi:integrase